VARFPPIHLARSLLSFERTLVMGVVNVTPDSFSDGGAHAGMESAVAFALRLVDEGADIVDVGGESTRPGARDVPAREEIARVVPVIRALAAQGRVPVSVDTTKAEVAAAALEAGAELVNDVSGGAFDSALPGVVDAAGAAYVLGHLRGRTIAETHAATPPAFDELIEELSARLQALPPGLRSRTIVDPGIGFGKGTADNVTILGRVGEIAAALARPVMVGPSRKRFLGELSGRPVDDRDDATIGASLAAVARGADVIRVHAVKKLRDALVVFERILR
jgi:dihydropteroate synthase